jgi:hypothetical protein
MVLDMPLRQQFVTAMSCDLPFFQILVGVRSVLGVSIGLSTVNVQKSGFLIILKANKRI